MASFHIPCCDASLVLGSFYPCVREGELGRFSVRFWFDLPWVWTIQVQFQLRSKGFAEKQLGLCETRLWKVAAVKWQGCRCSTRLWEGDFILYRAPVVFPAFCHIFEIRNAAPRKKRENPSRWSVGKVQKLSKGWRVWWGLCPPVGLRCDEAELWQERLWHSAALQTSVHTSAPCNCQAFVEAFVLNLQPGIFFLLQFPL